LYRRDLAFIHDAGFGGPSRGAARLLKRTLAKRRLPRGLVVDLGCGSGLLAKELSEAGYPVLGIDVSGPILRIARERAPEARFRRESLFAARLPQAVAVTAIGECLNYRSDENAPSPRLNRFFRRVHRALLPGGLFLFDIAGWDRAPRFGRREATLEGTGWSVTAVTEIGPKRGMLTRTITTVRKIGKTPRKTVERHRVQLVDPLKVTEWLRDAGFEVRSLRRYETHVFPRGIHGYLCVKRA
jgi:SAM-dependent methyltransferase